MDRIAGLLEELVRDAGLAKAPSQNRSIDGILCRRAFAELVQQPPCIAVATMVEQYLDPRICDSGERSSGTEVTKSLEYGLGRLRIIPLGVKPDHFRRQHRRDRIRVPGIVDTLECVVASAHRAEVGGILDRRYGGIFGMRRQRRAKPGSVCVEIETRRRRAVLRHCPVNARKPRPQCLCQPKLCQQLADAAIAGRWRRDRCIRREVPRLDTGNRAWIADDLHAIRVQKHLGRLHGFGAIALSIPSFSYQMTPKISLNIRCSISICENFSINGRTRPSDQLGMCSYNINP